MRAGQRPLGLREQVEDVGHEFGGDADARIPHLQHRLIALLLKAQPNLTAFVRVFRGVVEQVHDHLFQTGRVAVDPNGRRREMHGEFVPTLLDQEANRLYATFHDSPHVQLLPLKMNPTCRNAGHFQQIIHQMDQLPKLTLNDGAGLLLKPALAPLKPQAVAQRSRWEQGGCGVRD